MYSSDDADVLISIQTKPFNKKVILTFDDGPGRVLPEILDILKEETVPAIFFWQSRLLYPNRPWKRVLDEGHLIGTHSTKHANLVNLPFQEQYRDLLNSKRKIETITGQEVRYFRPPFGQYNHDTILAARDLGLIPVMWRISSMDWELKDRPEQIIANITDNLEDGAIILLHELPQTVEALPDLIAEIRGKGYGFSLLTGPL